MLKLSNKKSLNIVDDQFGAPTYARDIAKLIILLINRFDKEGFLDWGIYHFTGDVPTTWYGFASDIFEKAKLHGLISHIPKLSPIPTSQYPTPAKRPLNSRLSLTKISNLFDLDNSWSKGLEHMLLQLKSSECE